MMIRKTLLILLFISYCSYGQYTAIPDINFEKHLISLDYDDAIPDGRVLTSKIDKILYLDISSKLIENLTGIEDFTSLRNLICNSNKLTNLNISKNLDLTNLNCSNNKIKDLDITQNIKLQTIDISFNELSTINTTNNSNLVSLYCNNNVFNNLDVSKNIELRTLNCTQNRLTILDISNNVNLFTLKCNKNILYGLNLKNGKNTALTLDSDFTENPNLSCIQVDDAIYSTSKWFRLKETSATFYEGNCMEYTIIPDVNFEAKLISLKIDKDGLNGKIFTFDAKKTKNLSLQNNNSSNKIKTLSGIEDFTSLESINCGGNILETLDFYNNKNLQKIDCTGNNLTYLNVLECSDLKELNCYDNKLVNLNLSKNTALQYLSCHKNQLVELNIDTNVLLTNLWCDFNQLTTLNVSKNLNLEILYSNFNQLNTLDVSNNLVLSDLRLSGNKLNDIDISKNTELIDFRCDSNNLTTLNLKNGKNTNLNDEYLDFTKNPNLTCIQVDNEAYAKTNWSKKKDSTASFSNTCTLGIKDSIFKDVSIYPIPSKGELYIENVILEKVDLYNSTGQFIKTDSFSNGSTTNKINLSGLSEGVFYIYLKSEGNTIVKKIILN